MVAAERNIVWCNEAKAQLKAAYHFIFQDAPEGAHKVRAAIIALTRSLPANPERHAPDKYKVDNDGSYRAFEKYNYRITYSIRETEIRVLRVRHAKLNPLHY